VGVCRGGAVGGYAALREMVSGNPRAAYLLRDHWQVRLPSLRSRST
jgi:hypothetical protein